MQDSPLIMSIIPIFLKHLEVVGQCSPGMKPLTYHEVSGNYLIKEVRDKKITVKDHREVPLWWIADEESKNDHDVGDSPKGSLFLEFINVSESSISFIKMFLFFLEHYDEDKSIKCCSSGYR